MEERQFLRTLSGGITRLNLVIGQLQSGGGAVIPGEDAFTLKDTYGFPARPDPEDRRRAWPDGERGGYNRAMAEQRTRSRGHRAVQARRRGRDLG